MLCFAAYAPDKGRDRSASPVHSYEVQARTRRHSAIVQRITRAVEHWHVDPAEIKRVPGAPHDARDAGRMQVELRNLLLSVAVVDHLGRHILRCIEALAEDVFVDLPFELRIQTI